MKPKPTEESRKLDYLYAFEAEFYRKCREEDIDPSKWTLGLWCNAHMYHGMGLTVEDGVSRWFGHVAAQKRR